MIPAAILHQQTTRTADACIGGWGWVRCALFRVRCSSVQFWLFVAIELAFQVNSSWREVRRQLPPLQLFPSWRFEVSGWGFPTRPLALCMESKLITWKRGGSSELERTPLYPPLVYTTLALVRLEQQYYRSVKYLLMKRLTPAEKEGRERKVNSIGYIF